MGIKVAIMGATGAVGTELLQILEERKFAVDELRLLASARSAGKSLTFRGKSIKVDELTHDSFGGIQLVLASAGGKISKEFAPSAVKAGAVVVDNTSYFRMTEGVPLVVPEVNPEDIARHKGIIANPNCSTIIMNVPVWPLHKRFGVKRIVAATYQAASGAGAVAMDELIRETEAHIQGKPFERTVIPHPYAFNLFPHNSPMTDSGYCEEELKMLKETRKIFHDDSLRITATCVRVPVLRAHAEALNIEFDQDPSVRRGLLHPARLPGGRGAGRPCRQPLAHAHRRFRQGPRAGGPRPPRSSPSRIPWTCGWSAIRSARAPP